MNDSKTNVVSEEKSTKSNKFSWYSLRVISGKEKTIEENILYECENNKIDDLVEKIFVPFEKVVEIKNNKKKIKEKMFFPGYILIQMEMTKKSKYIVNNFVNKYNFI